MTSTGLITATDHRSGKTFQFQANEAVRDTLRMGQHVYADFGTQQVSVDGAQPCCAIMSVAPIP
ncbi:MAG: hypothetical protein EHM80_14165 [Nitrospiraceae bacterium]|nr:MAG: hypothetical protein EHM80_14165 [Nitrospiraceae bacterium]